MGLKENKDKFKVTYNVAWQIEKIEGFVYIYHIKEKYYLSLEGIAKKMWLKIFSGKTVNEIANEISLEYAVDYKVVEVDTMEFINDLVEKGVLGLYA